MRHNRINAATIYTHYTHIEQEAVFGGRKYDVKNLCGENHIYLFWWWVPRVKYIYTQRSVREMFYGILYTWKSFIYRKIILIFF